MSGSLHLICRPCAKAQDVEDRFNAAVIRTIGENGEGGCNLCGKDIPLAEVRMSV